MQRFLGTIDFGSIFAFAYPKAAQPAPPSLSEKYANETREKVQREHFEHEERERLLAMSQEQRKEWIAEQRAKLEESRRLRAMTQPERREYVERVRREHEPVQYRRTVSEPADDEQPLLFTPPVSTERETPRNGDGRCEPRDYESSYARIDAEIQAAWDAADDETKAAWTPFEDWLRSRLRRERAWAVEEMARGVVFGCDKVRDWYNPVIADLQAEITKLQTQVEMLTRMLSGSERKTLRLPNWRKQREAA